MKTGIGSHTLPHRGVTNTWLTPRWIVDALTEEVPFDLDPCAAPSPRPWDTAMHHITLPEDGLISPWYYDVCKCGYKVPYKTEVICPEHGTEGIAGFTRMRVWLNPPYGPDTSKWLRRMSRHGVGTALVFARVETKAWGEYVWPYASGVFFLNKRPTFCLPDGTPGKANSGGPIALITYGKNDLKIIERAWEKGTITGTLVTEWTRNA